MQFILDENAKWECYGCNKTPLVNLVTEAKELQDYLKEKLKDEEKKGKRFYISLLSFDILV